MYTQRGFLYHSGVNHPDLFGQRNLANQAEKVPTVQHPHELQFVSHELHF